MFTSTLNIYIYPNIKIDHQTNRNGNFEIIFGAASNDGINCSSYSICFHSVSFYRKHLKHHLLLETHQGYIATNQPTQTHHSYHYITLHYRYFIWYAISPKVTSGASTKFCTTVSICQCKQMSFQLPFESTRISKFLESKRKIIPSFRSGIREASLAELALQ